MTDADEAGARVRLEALFGALDRLTPDDLARIGYRPALDEERGPLLAAVEVAAARTGRVALLREAREAVRVAVMSRYSAGAFHPTFVGLNWGLSQGTVADRVAIAEAFADAAAVAVVEDVLDPEVAAALTTDAVAMLGLASGDVSDGSLARALRDADDPELRPWPRTRRARRAALVAMAATSLMASFGVVGAAAVGIAAAIRGKLRGGVR